MNRIMLIGALGLLGTLCRLFVTDLFARFPALHSFPWTTLTVNLIGCFAIGVIYTLDPGEMSTWWRAVIGIGFLGAFTTFSSMMWDTLVLIDRGQISRAGVYIVVSVGIGLAMTVAGESVGRSL